MSLVEELTAPLRALPPADRALAEGLLGRRLSTTPCWIPNPGPQTEAYYCLADVLLYGGQGGGGKTDLLCGTALTSHSVSLLMRRQHTDLGALIRRALSIYGTRQGFNGSTPPSLRTRDGRFIEWGSALHAGDEQSWQGQPHDLLGVDEVVHFLESQIMFLMGWVRSTDPKRRTRVILASNPPLDAQGQWIVGMFRPWLDVTHHRPAKPGELRWYITDPDGKDTEVDGPRPIELQTGKGRETFIPKSRTFIPATLDNNPFLIRTNYKSTLDALPEPLRSAVRDGNFMAARGDAAMQVIPTDWVIGAQNRWRPDGWRGQSMTALACDPAGGGRDDEVIAVRYGGWYGPLLSHNGKDTAEGTAVAGRIMRARHHSCPIVLDVGGGYAGGAIVCLKDNEIPYTPFDGSATVTTKNKAGMRYKNKRAWAYWSFREELDPDQEGGSEIALPPDPELLADLTAPTWEPKLGGIVIESKADIRERLGRSTGKGDAVVMALAEGQKQAVRKMTGQGSMLEQGIGGSGRRPVVVMGYPGGKRRR